MEQLAAIAAEVVPTHKSWIAQGYVLKTSSRLYRRGDGSWTGRFLYETPAAAKGVNLAMTWTVKGFRFE